MPHDSRELRSETHFRHGLLASIKDVRALQPLRMGLRDQHVVVRRVVATALGYFGDPDAADALVAALADTDDGVRWNSAVSLGEIRARDAVDALAERLNDKGEDVNIRKAAADSLGTIQNPAAIPLLIEAFRESGGGVQWHAAAALAKFDGPEVAEVLTNSLRGGEYNIVAAAHEYFIRRGDADFIPVLVAALRDHGYSAMAEDYIKSGIPLLVQAGRDWVAREELEITFPEY